MLDKVQSGAVLRAERCGLGSEMGQFGGDWGQDVFDRLHQRWCKSWATIGELGNRWEGGRLRVRQSLREWSLCSREYRNVFILAYSLPIRHTSAH